MTLDVAGLAEPATGAPRLDCPTRGAAGSNALHLRRGRLLEPGRARRGAGRARRSPNANAAGARRHGRRRAQRPLAAAAHRRHRALARVRLRDPGAATSSPTTALRRPLDEPRGARRRPSTWTARSTTSSLALAPGAREADVIAAVDRAARAATAASAPTAATTSSSHRFLTDEIAAEPRHRHGPAGRSSSASPRSCSTSCCRAWSRRSASRSPSLKAFGYANARDRRATTSASRWRSPCVGAAARRSALGGWARLGVVVNAMYAQFFRFPILRYEPSATVVVAIAVGVALAAAARRRARRRAPRGARCRRPRRCGPSRPPRFRAGLARARSVSRAHPPRRAAWSCATSRAGPCARRPLGARHRARGRRSSSSAGSSTTRCDWLVDVQFRAVQREDVTVALPASRRPRATRSRARARCPACCAPSRSAPCRCALRFEHRNRRVALIGLDRDGELQRAASIATRSVRAAAAATASLLTAELADDPRRRARATRVDGRGARRGPRRCATSRRRRRRRADRDLGLHGARRAATACSARGGVVSGGVPRASTRARRAPLYARLKRMPAVAGASSRTRGARELRGDDRAEHRHHHGDHRAVFARVIAFARRLQRRAHRALGARARAGEPARARLHARRGVAACCSASRRC